jgi:hypothetical protein
MTSSATNGNSFSHGPLADIAWERLPNWPFPEYLKHEICDLGSASFHARGCNWFFTARYVPTEPYLLKLKTEASRCCSCRKVDERQPRKNDVPKENNTPSVADIGLTRKHGVVDLPTTHLVIP